MIPNWIQAISSLLFTSAVIAAVITAYFTKKNNDRNLKLKYITEERQNWRKAIKEKVAIVLSSDDPKIIRQNATELMLSLNPEDNEDKKIVACLKQIIQGNAPEDVKDRLIFLTSQLLKYEWEKAKNEAKLPGEEQSDWQRRVIP